MKKMRAGVGVNWILSLYSRNVKLLKIQGRGEAYFFLDLFAYFFHQGKNVGQGLRDKVPLNN